MDEKILIFWQGSGFGEALILARVAAILQDNGVDVIYKERNRIDGLIDCRKISHSADAKECSGYKFHKWIYSINDRTPIVLQYIHYYEQVLESKIKITRDSVPVIFYKMEAPTYDIVIHPSSGDWSVYRIWPYFDELKKILTKQGISWVDMDNRKSRRIYGIEYLNYVNNAKLYLGLETGPSHYVSSIAKNKTLIIQSGFAEYNFWAYGYQFEHMEIDVPCRPCYLNKFDIANGKGCPYNHKCMREIGPQDVFAKIERMLNGKYRS